MDNSGTLLGIAAIITAIGGIYGFKQSKKTDRLAIEIEKNRAINANKAELVKTEAISKAEVIKVETKAETEKLNLLIDNQMGFIRDLQEENRTQRKEMIEKDKLHREEMLQVRAEMSEYSRLMSICIEERSGFKAMYNALERQFKDTPQYKAAHKEVHGSRKINGKIEGKITNE